MMRSRSRNTTGASRSTSRRNRAVKTRDSGDGRRWPDLKFMISNCRLKGRACAGRYAIGVIILLIFLALPRFVHAQIGETLKQLEARYGAPVSGIWNRSPCQFTNYNKGQLYIG